jgi:hypothetical protein
MGVSLDVSRGHHMNGLLDDLMMVVNHVNRNYVRRDQKMVVMMDVSRVNRRTGVHLNAQLVYEHRVDLTIDPECYVRRDQMKDVNLDAMNLHVRYY